MVDNKTSLINYVTDLVKLDATDLGCSIATKHDSSSFDFIYKNSGRTVSISINRGSTHRIGRTGGKPDLTVGANTYSEQSIRDFFKNALN